MGLCQQPVNVVFHTISIIGVGLIGGSLGVEIKNRGLANHVIGFGRTKKNLSIALGRGLIDEAVTDMTYALKRADVILLCAPVQTILASLSLIAQHIKKEALVMDVGSTKEKICTKANQIFSSHGYFVGAHPLAGTEKKGAAHAVESLFLGKTCVLTPLPKNPTRIVKQAKSFWEALGCRVVFSSPAKHDALLAGTSHLPQMVAYALMNCLSRHMTKKEMIQFSGSGLQDTTRLAASPPDMWKDVIQTNSKPLTFMIRELKRDLTQIEKWISSSQMKELISYFKKSVELKRRLSP